MNTPNTPAIRSQVPGGSLARIDLDKLAIVGVRREGAALVIIESDPTAVGREHRCTTERELWLTLAAIADRQGAQIVDGKPSSELKQQREALSSAFGVLLKKGRAHAADKMGEETVGAVETIGKVAGSHVLSGLRRISTSGSSTLHRGSRRRKVAGGR